ALQALREERFDCMVVGTDVPDLSPVALAEELENSQRLDNLPVILYADGAVKVEPDAGWKKLAEHCTVRRAHSLERLLDQAAFFLHREIGQLPEEKRTLLEDLHRTDKVLAGKKVLIVDDDMRNIFALSTVLEEHEMVIAASDNGRDAIKMLQTQ